MKQVKKILSYIILATILAVTLSACASQKRSPYSKSMRRGCACPAYGGYCSSWQTDTIHFNTNQEPC